MKPFWCVLSYTFLTVPIIPHLWIITRHETSLGCNTNLGKSSNLDNPEKVESWSQKQDLCLGLSNVISRWPLALLWPFLTCTEFQKNKQTKWLCDITDLKIKNQFLKNWSVIEQCLDILNVVSEPTFGSLLKYSIMERRSIYGAFETGQLAWSFFSLSESFQNIHLYISVMLI